MKEKQRNRVLPLRSPVDEVKFLAVDYGAKVWKGVQLFFASPPVKLLCPVMRKLTHMRDGERVVISDLAGPSRPPQPLPLIFQDALLDIDLKLFNHSDVVFLIRQYRTQSRSYHSDCGSPSTHRRSLAGRSG